MPGAGIDNQYSESHCRISSQTTPAVPSWRLIREDLVPNVINIVVDLIQRDYATPADVPAHSRWRHFEAPSIVGGDKVDRIGHLLKDWGYVGTSKSNEQGHHDAVGEVDTEDTEATAGSKRKRARTNSGSDGVAPTRPSSRPSSTPIAPEKQKLPKSLHTEEALEHVRRLLDLFVVSVLLDAGAGSAWKYHPKGTPARHIMSRSEGLAVASYDWFIDGGLSAAPSWTADKHRVDSTKLQSISVGDVKSAFQVSGNNPLVGVRGRCELLNRLGRVLEDKKVYFGKDKLARPGFMLDYMLSHEDTTVTDDNHISVSMNGLWSVVMDGLSGVWPTTRTKLHNVSLGDVWPCVAMGLIAKELRSKNDKVITDYDESADSLVPFHKLSQWLTYSLMEPLSLLNITTRDSHVMTGLPEYRNGGLLLDYGVLELKEESVGEKDEDGIPTYHVHDDVIVEWRALTVAFLDKIGEGVREKLGMSIDELPLVKVLEAGTWKADGTVF
ncbi:hypothetical protein SeMB42_g06875 [Synchytrium endobioticum]|uniref:Uncharacterized protein n=1 Tax=Synchytrium endobioticum TaxID=286115 RepID=A0A507CI71_9FUNG|nr:hypothetical protein SeMB42_g06875 [Synchytrium endobioticum]